MELNSIKSGKHPEIFLAGGQPDIKYINEFPQILLAKQGRAEYQMNSFEKIKLVEES